MQGEGGAPYAIAPLAQALRAAGYLVATPEMPWSLRRNFEVGHERALSEVDAAVALLRREGAQRIVVGGHGLGGNTALAYAAQGSPVEGLLLLAPAHTPERLEFSGPVAASVNRARQLVAKGGADIREEFLDSNHRSTRAVTTAAGVYWSYFDPEGTAAMSRSAHRMPRALPVLWIYGSRDVLRDEGIALFFAVLPAHPRSRRVSLWAPFGGTPQAAVEDASAWLKSLDRN